MFGQGVAAFLTKDYALAQECLENCLKTNPQFAAAEFLFGEVSYAQEKPELAVGHYQNALRLDSHMEEATVHLARIFAEQKNYNEAYRQWSKVLVDDPANKEALSATTELDTLIGHQNSGSSQSEHPLAGAIVIAHSSSTADTVMLRVGLAENIATVELWAQNGLTLSNGTAAIAETDGKDAMSLNDTAPFFHNSRSLFITTKTGGSGIVIKGIKTADGRQLKKMIGRQYRGKMALIKTPKGMKLVNEVSIDDYLYSVLPSQMIPWWPIDALRAQAVVSRTQALYRARFLKPHAQAGYDVCDSPHCLNYSGISEEVKAACAAVNDTHNLILTMNGKLADAPYMANCGGSEFCAVPANSDERYTWLQQAPNNDCAQSKYASLCESRWARIETQEELAERVNAILPAGKIKKITADTRSASGNITQLSITGTKDTIILDHPDEIMSLAAGNLRSTNFVVEGYDLRNGIPQLFVFWGAGWGNGAGLCQAGAATLAEKGMNYRGILGHYYKNMQLSIMGQ
jgi:SpoIID/LytB domain protein